MYVSPRSAARRAHRRDGAHRRTERTTRGTQERPRHDVRESREKETQAAATLRHAFVRYAGKYNGPQGLTTRWTGRRLSRQSKLVVICRLLPPR